MKYTHRNTLISGTLPGSAGHSANGKIPFKFDAGEGKSGSLRPPEFPMETFFIKHGSNQDHRCNVKSTQRKSAGAYKG